MADYPIEDDRSLYHVTCSGSLSLGKAHVQQVKPVGKEAAVDDGESLDSEQAAVFWARISLQLWKDEEKQCVCLYFQMFFTE